MGLTLHYGTPFGQPPCSHLQKPNHGTALPAEPKHPKDIHEKLELARFCDIRRISVLRDHISHRRDGDPDGNGHALPTSQIHHRAHAPPQENPMGSSIKALAGLLNDLRDFDFGQSHRPDGPSQTRETGLAFLSKKNAQMIARINRMNRLR